MLPYILGIDIGTGSTKGVALGLDGTSLSASQHYYTVDHPLQGYCEQDPELIWQAFSNCIIDSCQRLGPPVAISLSSAMHSLVALDQNGLPLTALIIWADVRSETIAKELRNSSQGEKIYRQTGTPIHPMSPLCKLIWLRENEPDLFNKAAKFISIKEYIWHKLFNVFQIDYSIASSTGLFDILNLCWSEDACSLAGITASQLSEPVNTSYRIDNLSPELAKSLQLSANTSFVIGASDGCCANLGSYVNGPGIAALTVGTSGAVRITGTAPVYNYKAMTFNYLLDEKTFVSGGAVNNGGSAVDWLLKKFSGKSDKDYVTFFKTIKQVSAGSDGLLFLPYLYGERAPVWDGKSSAAFLNIRPEHSQDHFLRAGLEGICYALNDVLQNLEKLSLSVTQINISGGFTASITWMQLLADVTGKKLVVVQKDDASAIGAVYLAMRILYPEKELPQPDQNQVIVLPDAGNHTKYAAIFPLYQQMYSVLKDSMHQLYNLAN